MKIGERVDLGMGFWRINRLVAGAMIDGIRGQNIPLNSKAIDRTDGLHRIISHKSTDVRLPSYLCSGSVCRIGMRFVRKLADYQGEIRMDHRKKTTYHLHWAVENPQCQRVLEWFVPEEGVTAQQESELERVVEEGAAQGVEVLVFRVSE